MIATNDWLFNVLSDDELFEDGYFFNLSDGDIIEVNMDSSVGTVEHTLEPLGQMDDNQGTLRISSGSKTRVTHTGFVKNLLSQSKTIEISVHMILSSTIILQASVNDIPMIINGETVRHRPRSRQSGNVSPIYRNEATINTISGH